MSAIIWTNAEGADCINEKCSSPGNPGRTGGPKNTRKSQGEALGTAIKSSGGTTTMGASWTWRDWRTSVRDTWGCHQGNLGTPSRITKAHQAALEDLILEKLI